MIVCIAEKPSVAKDIAQVLGADRRKDGYFEGNGYQVTWTYGHLCTLKEPHDYVPDWKHWRLSDLPMMPAHFGIKLLEDEGVKKQFQVIKGLFEAADEIVNCGDAGQEGEVIQRWVLQQTQCGTKKVKRLWISSLTEEAIKEGFQHLADSTDYDKLYAAGCARAIGDWLLGMNATRLYTLMYGQNRSVLSVGRVQTPTLALVVKRQEEIEHFVPEPYWELKTNYREVMFSLKQGQFKSKSEAQKVLDSLQGSLFKITKVDTKKGKEAPPRLFDLTSLQVECNKKFGYTAEQTLQIIQSLYEKKLTTYPRVDTTYLPSDVYPKVKNILKGLTPYQKWIEPILQQKTVRKSTAVFNDAKVTDHHAIIPTGKFGGSFTNEEKWVYDLVTRRFIAAFYPDCEVANTMVEGEAASIAFKVTGKQVIEPAWRVLFAKDKAATDEEEPVLPVFEVGEEGPHQPDLLEKQTQAPKFYTEATLLRAMETAGKTVDNDDLRDVLKENGIGRPSTRANIIETLFKRRYIVRDRKRILATPTGVDLIAAIENDLLKSAELTGRWEKKMRDIEHGTYEMNTFMGELRQMVDEVVRQVKAGGAKKITILEAASEAESSKDKPKEKTKKKSTKKQTL